MGWQKSANPNFDLKTNSHEEIYFFPGLLTFVLAITGAFASINYTAAPANLYTKVNGVCQINCALTEQFICMMSGPLYSSSQNCMNEQNPVTIGFQPLQ